MTSHFLMALLVVVSSRLADSQDCPYGTAARAVRLEVQPGGYSPVVLGWGDQIDTRPITLGAGRDDQAGDVHPEMVAAYLAKYLTKSTEDFGLDGHGRVHSATDARCLGAAPHALRIIETAEQLVASGGADYQRLADRYGTLGYRGHVMTKTRRYSTTFGALRKARAEWRQPGGPSWPAITTTPTATRPRS